MVNLRILIVEDDHITSNYLINGLQESGYIVDFIKDGLKGRDMALEGIYNALIIERMLPRLDGISLVKQLRANNLNVPIMMLSGLGEAYHKAEGLQAGCDDYLSKPYAFIELVTRLACLIYRSSNINLASLLQVADLQLDREKRRVMRQGYEIKLQLRQYLILEQLMLHAEQVVTRSMLLESAWNYDFDPKDNFIDKHIYQLRQRIDSNYSPQLIHTIKGAGYMLSNRPLK